MISIINKRLFKVIILVFSVFLVIANIFVVKKLPDQQINDGSYEQLIKRNGKTKLTQDILDHDFQEYIKDKKTGRIVCLIISFIIVPIAVIFLIYTILRFIKDNNKEIQKTQYIIKIIILLGFIVTFTVIIVFTLSYNDEENKSYNFVEHNIKDSEVKRSGTKGNHDYYLIMDNGDRVDVSEKIYNKFKDSNYFGIYYAGETEDGIIFSLYSSQEYEYEFENKN